MFWENFFRMLGFVPFIMAAVVLVYVAYKSYTEHSQREYFYSAICAACNFVNADIDIITKNELTEKIFNIWDKCLWGTERYDISKIIMKKEKDKTIYLAEMYSHSSKGISSLGQTVLFVKLPLNIKNTYLIHEKKDRQIKETSSQEGLIPPPAFIKQMSQRISERQQKREENPVRDLSLSFSEKFDAYTMEGPDENGVLTNEIQQLLINHKGKYPFIDCVKKMILFGTPLAAKGKIVISSGSISIYALNTSQQEHLTDLLNLSNGLVELLAKSQITAPEN